MSNRHMNVFHHYSQNGALPIENNVSRGLAILLEEYPTILLLFLQRIRGKMKDRIVLPDPEGTYEVEFQQDTAKLDYASRIVGVALTAKGLPGEFELFESSNENEVTSITDICVTYDDTILFVEVKRTDEDCRDQLTKQMNSCELVLCANNNINNRQITIEKCLVELTWTDIIELLNQYTFMNKGIVPRLVRDYLESLRIFYPKWFPVEPLSSLSVCDDDRINQRIERIKQDYMKKYNKEGELAYLRNAIPLDWGYASECNIFIDDLEVKSGKTHCLVIGVWPSDTGSQYWQLEKVSPKLQFANKQYQTINVEQYGDVNLRIMPYIKFCHFNRGIYSPFADNMIENHSDAIVELAHAITGRWDRGQNDAGWIELFDELQTRKVFTNEKLIEVNDKFKELFTDSKRKYLTCSVGFEVFAYLSFEEAQQLDDRKKSETNFIDFLANYIKSVKSFIG